MNTPPSEAKILEFPQDRIRTPGLREIKESTQAISAENVGNVVIRVISPLLSKEDNIQEQLKSFYVFIVKYLKEKKISVRSLTNIWFQNRNNFGLAPLTDEELFQRFKDLKLQEIEQHKNFYLCFFVEFFYDRDICSQTLAEETQEK